PSKLLNLETEGQLVTSTAVVQIADGLLPPGVSPVGLSGHIDAKQVKGSGALEISYVGPSDESAAAIATAFAKAYLMDRQSTAQGLVDAQVQTLTTDIADAGAQIRHLHQVIASAPRGSAAAADARTGIAQEIQRQAALQNRLDNVQLVNTDPGAIIRPAQVPTRPIRPNRLLDIALALLLGFGAAVAVAAGRDLLDPRVRDREAVVGALGAPLLSAIPVAKKVGPTRVIAFDHPGAQFTEALRVLRAAVIAALPEGGTVLITSAQPEEGRSTITANLGAVLAQAGQEVVLLSADLRKPTLHEIFDVSNAVGLSSVLSRRIELRDGLIESSSPNLVICPAGPPPPDAAELLQSDAMRQLVAGLRQGARYVILDCPPVLGLSDTLGLVSLADAVIFVVDATRTKRVAVEEACYRIRQLDAPLLGGVLNKARPSIGLLGYGYGNGCEPAGTSEP
ncbi:MAG: polysaccharide biosynthesis transport protein, partial [Actinomycetota bacterium]|nr:polysaccharide biosynthesis transport protein [Actinomycetota bacterium]